MDPVLFQAVPKSQLKRFQQYIKTLSGLVAYYPLNESSGDAINRAPATYGTLNGTNTSVTQGVVGQKGRSYSYDGVASYTDVGNPTPPATITFFAIVKRSSFPGAAAFQDILRKESSYSIELTGSNDTNGLAVAVKDPAEKKITIPKADMAQDTWYLVVGTTDGSNLTAYLNNVAYGPAACGATGNSAANKIFIGTYGTTTPSLGRWFQGFVQHVGIMNRTITAAEVTKLAHFAGLI